MSLALDIILVAIFGATVYGAAKRGFVKSLLDFAAVILALVLSFQLSPLVATEVYDAYVEERIMLSIEKELSEKTNSEKTQEAVQITVSAVPNFVYDIAKSLGVDTDKIEKEITTFDFSSENAAKELTEKVIEPIAIEALNVVCFVILYIILAAVLDLLAGMISKIFKLPLLGTANKLLGALLGAAKGVVVVIFFAAALQLLFSGGDGELAEAVNSSRVIAMLDNINPICDSFKSAF